MLSFGERLKMARERAGLTQIDVYKATNINNKSLSRYENDATSPDPNAIKSLVELYNVSADFILGLSDEPNTSMPVYETDYHSDVILEDHSSYITEILQHLSSLSENSRSKVLDYIKMLAVYEQKAPSDDKK